MKQISDEAYEKIMAILKSAATGNPPIDTQAQREAKLLYLAQEAKNALKLLVTENSVHNDLQRRFPG